MPGTVLALGVQCRDGSPGLPGDLEAAIASGNLWVPKSRWRRERLGWYDLPLSQLSSPPTEAGTGDKVYVQGPRPLMSSPPGPG